MVKRKCGTCRYFRDAGIACSGWCTHPERGEYHDLVLVRQAELACRNSWDQDLWQPRHAGSSEAVEARLRAHEPNIPRVAEVDSQLAARPPIRDNPTDRVTSILLSRFDTGGELRDPPAVAGGQSAQPDSPDRPDRGDARDMREGGSAQAGVSALEPGYKLALHGSKSRRSDRRHEGRTDVSATDERGTSQKDRPVRGTRVSSSAVGDETSPLPVVEVRRALERASFGTTDVHRQRQARPEATPGASLKPSVPKVHVDGVDLSDVTEPATFSVAATSIGPAPIDETKWVAGLPRCCDTCRDFQRDSNGRSGICGNPYAFQRPTVVECDQLACRSSVGVWWLPNDDFWLDRADISHHTRPTPYLDAVLSELRPGGQ